MELFFMRHGRSHAADEGMYGGRYQVLQKYNPRDAEIVLIGKWCPTS